MIPKKDFYPGRMCVWKIVEFSGCRRKPTSPCPLSSERPVLGSSQRDGTSAADAMVEKIQFQKILKNLRLFVKNHSCIATFRPLLGSQQLPLVPQTTPLAPQVPPGSTPIDGGGILLFLDFRHFRPLAPHTRPPRTLYVHSTTDPTPKASLSLCRTATMTPVHEKRYKKYLKPFCSQVHEDTN